MYFSLLGPLPLRQARLSPAPRLRHGPWLARCAWHFPQRQQELPRLGQRGGSHESHLDGKHRQHGGRVPEVLHWTQTGRICVKYNFNYNPFSITYQIENLFIFQDSTKRVRPRLLCIDMFNLEIKFKKFKCHLIGASKKMMSFFIHFVIWNT